MTRWTYRVLAITTLPLPLLAAWLTGRVPAAWIAERVSGELGALLPVLIYLLAALVFVALWGAALLPLRARAGFSSIRDELTQIEAAGGLDAAIEQVNARARSPDPKVRAAHHYTHALVAALLGGLALVLTALLWSEGYVWTFPLAAVLLCPPYAGVHLARGLVASRQAG